MARSDESPGEDGGFLARSILRLETESRNWQLEIQALNLQLAQSRREYEELSAVRDQLVQDVHDLRIDRDKLRDQLTAVLESRSWKIGSKLVRAARFMRP